MKFKKMREPDQSIRKITFTSNQLKLADYKAKRLGLSFPEYIKHLISNDVKDILKDFDGIDINTLEDIEDGVDETKHLKFTAVKHKKDLQDLLEKWKQDGF